MQQSFDETASQPQRFSRASVALITRTRNGQTEWLLQWNNKWQTMNLIAGHREPTDVNDMACLVREIHEELFEPLPGDELAYMQAALKSDNDTYVCVNSDWLDAGIETITRTGSGPFECDDFSESAKCMTHYVFHVYAVKLRSNVSFLQQGSFIVLAAQVPVPNEWGCAGDIRRSVTALNRRISPNVQRMLSWVETQECS